MKQPKIPASNTAGMAAKFDFAGVAATDAINGEATDIPAANAVIFAVQG